MGDVGRVRSRRTGAGELRYFLDFRPLGRVYSVRDALGEQPLRSEEEAERLLARIRARVEDGQSLEVVLGLLRPDGSSSVEKRVAAWLAEKRRKADAGEITRASLERIEGEVRRYWKDWGDVPVRAVKAAQVADWATWLHESGLAPVTVRVCVGTFRSFLGWLEEREEIEKVPRMPRVRVPERSPRLLSQAHQEAALAAIPEPERGVYLLLVDLAVRPNEARAVSRSDFELEGPQAWVTIRRAVKGMRMTDPIGPTKTGTVRRIPVTDRLAAWVRRFGSDSDPFEPVFGRLSSWTLNREWKAACKRAGVPVVPVRESTRHSTATRWRQARAPLEDVRDLLGHTNSKTTELYARPDRAHLIELVSGSSTPRRGSRKRRGST